MKISSIILSIILATLILFNSLRVALTYTYYELDPIGFIENLCENKDQPELQCNGKCHLNKVSKSQNKEQKTPESIIDFKEIILYPNPVVDVILSDKDYTKKQGSIAYQNLYSFNTSNDCFHPPRV